MSKPEYLSTIAVEPMPAVDGDKLGRLTSKAAELRLAFLEKVSLEERTKDNNKKIEHLKFTELPELMFECHIASWTLEAEGNMPQYKLERKPFYYANIKADDPLASQGFDWLDCEHPGIVRTVFTISFGAGEEKASSKFEAVLKKEKIGYEKKRSVPWNTLTAFLKEQVEKYKSIPPLNLLGAKIATVVDMKPVKTQTAKPGKAGEKF